jgi:hypothetical protein
MPNIVFEFNQLIPSDNFASRPGRHVACHAALVCCPHPRSLKYGCACATACEQRPPVYLGRRVTSTQNCAESSTVQEEMRPFGWDISPLPTRLYYFNDFPHAAYRSEFGSFRQIIEIKVPDFRNL